MVKALSQQRWASSIAFICFRDFVRRRSLKVFPSISIPMPSPLSPWAMPTGKEGGTLTWFAPWSWIKAARSCVRFFPFFRRRGTMVLPEVSSFALPSSMGDTPRTTLRRLISRTAKGSPHRNPDR